MDKQPLFILTFGALALGSCKPAPAAPAPRSSVATPSLSQRAGASQPPGATTVPVASRVREIVAEQLGLSLERVSLGSTWKQLGADSLDTVELIMAFEEEFKLEISDAQAEAMKTVGDVVTYVRLNRKR